MPEYLGIVLTRPASTTPPLFLIQTIIIRTLPFLRMRANFLLLHHPLGQHVREPVISLEPIILCKYLIRTRSITEGTHSRSTCIITRASILYLCRICRRVGKLLTQRVANGMIPQDPHDVLRLLDFVLLVVVVLFKRLLHLCLPGLLNLPAKLLLSF